MSHRFAQQVAIVSGGAQGIGRAIATQLAVEGATVVVADTDQESGESCAAELRRAGHQMHFVPTDISRESSVKEVMTFVGEDLNRLDVLVNSAGAFIMRGVEAEVHEWRTMFDVNVMGFALMAKHAAPLMRRSGGGAIVNVSSISAFIAQPGLTTYSTMKAAVTHLTRMLAQELAPEIRVNAVCPGTIYSDNNARVLKSIYGVDRSGADRHPQVGGLSMLGRVGDPREVAKAVAFLASDDASFITAENLVIDGGQIAQ